MTRPDRKHLWKFSQRHAEVGCKTFLRIMKVWGASQDEAASLLGVAAINDDPSKLARLITADQLLRISYVIGIFHDQRFLFYPFTRHADQGMRKPICIPPFNRVSLLDFMLANPDENLPQVRQWLSDQVKQKP